MAARYSPIYSGVWNDEHLEGASFECKAFFVFLWSNERVRPSGIYRVTDPQLAVDTGLPLRRVRSYVEELVRRCRIVRDGAWLFVRGYLARQPKQENLLSGVRRDVAECTSRGVLMAFSEKYPLYRQWSDDHLATLPPPSPDGSSSEQLQSRAVTEQLQSRAVIDGRATVAHRLLKFLNEKTGRTYQPVPANLKLLDARLRDGATEANIRGVIARKVREWQGDPKMAEYLRPKTLFNATNFAQYLGQREAPDGDMPAV